MLVLPHQIASPQNNVEEEGGVSQDAPVCKDRCKGFQPWKGLGIGLSPGLMVWHHNSHGHMFGHCRRCQHGRCSLMVLRPTLVQPGLLQVAAMQPVGQVPAPLPLAWGLWDWDCPRWSSLHRVLLLPLCQPLFWGGGTRMAAVAVAVTTVWAAAALGLATAVIAMGAAYWRLAVCVAKCLTMSSELQFKRLPTVAKMCEKFYPAAEGWVIRVYHDFEATDPNFRSVMCKASCEFANIDFCYVKSLQAPLDSYASPSVHPMIWRFLPMADPRTDIFLSRDLDSDITQRELDAVNDWLSSGKILHSMRDNPNHGATILGGMWGTSKLSQLAKNVNWEEIESKMLKQIGANPVIRSMKGLDQVIIGSVVYPAVCKTPELAKSFCKIHDSYFCKTFGDSDPWPSQRNLTVRNNFVGANGHGPMKIPCPVECRPKDHQDWEFC
ncbi:unnamed protein product [Notodromas monacha]|uniref:Uncharacterized protein n=1 Tax=Notodromas monacha TaxID=399045 RepID=A0A7R9BRW4_9CRUS|nr:unnamed protein product [Notodromas monacha]CAG0920569.1 unnamed protein product [Notodromas monacha]